MRPGLKVEREREEREKAREEKARKTANPLDIEPPRCTLSYVLEARGMPTGLKVVKEGLRVLTLSLRDAL